MKQAFTKSVDKIYYDLDGLDDPQSRLYFEASFEDLRAGFGGWYALPWLAAGTLALNNIATYLQHPEVPKNTDPVNVQRAEALANTASIGLIDKTEAAKEFAAILFTLAQDRQYGQPNRAKELGTKYGINGGGEDEIWTPASPPGHPEHEFQKEVIRVLNDTIDQAINKWETDPVPNDKEQRDPRGFLRNQQKRESSMKTFETFENKVLKWVTEADSKFDQDVFNILSDMEAEIETGEYPQEEIVDMVSDRLEKQRGRETSTDEGSQIERQVEEFYGMLGLDSVPADRRSRDYLDDRPSKPDRPTGVPHSPFDDDVRVPARVEGRPWIHTDDDFILFLEWVLKQTDEFGDAKYTGRSVVDMVTSPTDGWVVKLYKSYLVQRDREEADPLL